MLSTTLWIEPPCYFFLKYYYYTKEFDSILGEAEKITKLLLYKVERHYEIVLSFRFFYFVLTAFYFIIRKIFI